MRPSMVDFYAQEILRELSMTASVIVSARMRLITTSCNSLKKPYLYFPLVRNAVMHLWFSDVIGYGVTFGPWSGLFVEVQLGHQRVAV